MLQLINCLAFNIYEMSFPGLFYVDVLVIMQIFRYD